MLTVASVLKVEPESEYSIDYVHRLARGVRWNLSLPHRFVCLSDLPAGNFDHTLVDEVIPLTFNLRGWWSKFELFNLPGPLIYFDLDTVIVGSLDQFADIAQNVGELRLLRGFYRSDPCTGVMSWMRSEDVRWIFDAFAVDAGTPDYFVQGDVPHMRMKSGSYRGDQEWLQYILQKRDIPTRFLQDAATGIVSYKVHVRQNPGRSLPDGAKIVCFHGHPRPHEVVNPPAWMGEHWGQP